MVEFQIKHCKLTLICREDTWKYFRTTFPPSQDPLDVFQGKTDSMVSKGAEQDTTLGIAPNQNLYQYLLNSFSKEWMFPTLVCRCRYETGKEVRNAVVMGEHGRGKVTDERTEKNIMWWRRPSLHKFRVFLVSKNKNFHKISELLQYYVLWLPKK